MAPNVPRGSLGPVFALSRLRHGLKVTPRWTWARWSLWEIWNRWVYKYWEDGWRRGWHHGRAKHKTWAIPVRVALLKELNEWERKMHAGEIDDERIVREIAAEKEAIYGDGNWRLAAVSPPSSHVCNT